MTRKQRYQYIVDFFRREMPQADTELEFGSVFQLLVAVILSAQCTDKRINQVTPELFQRYPDAHSMAAAEAEDIYQLIRSVSYPNAKAQHLVDMSRRLVTNFGGEVPADMKQLLSLPGVGRKTANVIQAVAFGQAKMAVDTHVYRVSHRLGLVSPHDNTPMKVERQLVSHLAENDIPLAHHWLLLHGRYVCTSQRPKCDRCGLNAVCPKLLHGSKLS